MNESILKFTNSVLSGCTIRQVIEIYQLDEEGKYKTRTIGFVKDPLVAEAYLADRYLRTTERFILEVEGQAFLIDAAPIVLLDEEQEILRIKAQALKKLTPAEIKLLGI
jgi:hypothetical protein